MYRNEDELEKKGAKGKYGACWSERLLSWHHSLRYQPALPLYISNHLIGETKYKENFKIEKLKVYV